MILLLQHIGGTRLLGETSSQVIHARPLTRICLLIVCLSVVVAIAVVAINCICALNLVAGPFSKVHIAGTGVGFWQKQSRRGLSLPVPLS